MPKGLDKTPYNMWSYWRDKHGVVNAMDYYPETLKNDPQIAAAVVALKNAEKLIDTLMSEKEDPDE